jgi:hypothetical protein
MQPSTLNSMPHSMPYSMLIYRQRHQCNLHDCTLFISSMLSVTVEGDKTQRDRILYSFTGLPACSACSAFLMTLVCVRWLGRCWHLAGVGDVHWEGRVNTVHISFYQSPDPCNLPARTAYTQILHLLLACSASCPTL